MRQLETIEAVTKIRFPGAKVRVAQPYEYDRVDIFIFYYLKRGKRQHTCRYGRVCIPGIVFSHLDSNVRSRAIAIELEYLGHDMDECLEKARLVGWEKNG